MVFTAFCLVLPQLPEGSGWSISAEFWNFQEFFPGAVSPEQFTISLKFHLYQDMYQLVINFLSTFLLKTFIKDLLHFRAGILTEILISGTFSSIHEDFCDILVFPDKFHKYPVIFFRMQLFFLIRKSPMIRFRSSAVSSTISSKRAALLSKKKYSAPVVTSAFLQIARREAFRNPLSLNSSFPASRSLLRTAFSDFSIFYALHHYSCIPLCRKIPLISD